jgi:glycine/D-amino acid oxidase-like deaminating enzyme
MDLHSGTPLWKATAPAVDLYPALTTDSQCEVLVVGAGVTGALAAYQLAREGVSVILVDGGAVGGGSTAASTGLLQYECDTPLVELVRKVGETEAVRAYRRGLEAIDAIEQIAAASREPCGFQRRDSLYFATRFWHRRRLRAEYECRKAHGFDVEFLNRAELKSVTSIQAAAAIRSRGDAEIDPLAFTRSVVRQAVTCGLQVHEGTQLTGIQEKSRTVVVTSKHAEILAKAIVYATGYDMRPHLNKRLGNLQSTYAVASQPGLRIDGWPDECLIWETARPYFYARRTVDGRVVMGGGDTAFRTDHRRGLLVERKSAALVRRFQQLFPGTPFQVEYQWAGTFAETKDGLAYIGQLRDRPRAYFALGYGGNGITFGMIAAQLIRDSYLQRPNPDAEVFRMDR